MYTEVDTLHFFQTMRTHFYALLILFVHLVSVGAASSSAPPSSLIDQQGDPIVRIRVVNSITGTSVDGAQFNLRNDQGHNVSRRLSAGKPLDVTSGSYDVQIHSPGYLPVATRVAVGPEVRSIEINIDPIETPRQLSTDYVRSLRRRDATVVVGCVVDEETRLPIAGARVLSVRDGRSVETDREGFFAIHVNVAYGSENRQPAAILVEHNGYQAQLRNYLEVSPNGDLNYGIRLSSGSGVEVVDERKNRRRSEELEKSLSDTCTSCGGSGAESTPSTFPGKTVQPSSTAKTLVATPVLSSMIRVGRNCTTTSSASCTTVVYYSLETYVKHVVVAEVYSCWGSLPGGMNSLQAFAVPVRSYGLWYVYHPISTYYDICSTTSCQVFGDATTTNGDSAATASAGTILTDNNGAVVRSEYSAENNNAVCGDGFAGTNTVTSPCIADPACAGKATAGHGRGLCQWGSVRWATGTVVATAAMGGAGACVLGPAHAYGTKDWLQIIAHYYPMYQLTQAISVSVLWAQFIPSTIIPDTTIYVVDSVLSSGTASLMLGAAIAPTGTTNWTWDPYNDVSIPIHSGKQYMARLYKVPAASAAGSYDLRVALWFDVNNNYVIDPQGPGGDVLISTYTRPNALTVTTPVSVESSDPALPQVPYLAQNFPNPFNPSTTIQFDLPAAAHVSLRIFNIFGQELRRLAEDRFEAGFRTVTFDAGRLASGVYVCRMDALFYDGTPPFSAVRRLVLLK